MKLTFDVPEEMAEKIAENIKVALEEHKQKQVWPQYGDNYYYVISDGTVVMTRYSDIYDNTDKERVKFGNCFKTEEEAEFKLEQLKVMHELEQLTDDDQIDAYNDYHYMLIYDFNESAVKINGIVCAGFMYGTHYFKTERSAQAAIDKIGADRLKKYYFCISEE